ncbi:MAG: DDE-type integrase/transposase/recombinase [Nitrososphaerota archaeon]|nr:DDE-type integrase/transposase/recombinase [Nitrososphaerota archaeon]MDG7026511.1 DDE-type integrase/transposase/recombinase [Nitrososphaerota archaeon]
MDKEYDVVSTETGWYCSCQDSVYRGVRCKHQIAVELSFILRKIVAKEPIRIHPVSIQECIFCRSVNLRKFGVRKTKAGGIQRFLCAGCGRTFSVNLGFEGMRASPQAITSAMQLYFTGESLRGVQKFLRLQGVNISHISVLNWIRKYVGLMHTYLDSLAPQLGDTWRTDELFLKVKGNMKYLFAMMDDDTRFWIAQQVSDTKGTSDVRPMFKEAEAKAGKRPKVLISDGAFNFGEATIKEWWTQRKETRVQHIRDIRLDGMVHNNKMERLNGEVRDREKVMRGVKRADTPILRGYQIYHNYLRQHEGLNGQTPSERAGIRIEGQNKWLTIIQNATRINMDTRRCGVNAKMEKGHQTV